MSSHIAPSSTLSVRAASLSLAALVLTLIVGWALLTRFPQSSDLETRSAGVEAWIESLRPPDRAPASATPSATAPGAEAFNAEAHENAPLMLAALRCASDAGRRINRELCAGVSNDSGASPEIGIRRIDGVLSRDGAMQRSLLLGLNSNARTYALGEAQKYIDPRDDPIWEEGADPATAAHRPCPSGIDPVGTGAALTGRTCQIYLD